MLFQRYSDFVEIFGKEDGLDQDQPPCREPEFGMGKGDDRGPHGMPHQRRPVQLKQRAESCKVLRYGKPAQAPFLRVCLAVVAEIRGNDAPAGGELAGYRMPQPWGKTRSMQEHDD